MGIAKKIWSFFVSIRLTILLLIILSIVCIIGTVVPQNITSREYAKLYSPGTLSFLKSAGFLDMYHAWWFIVLLAAFTLNLIACSLNRLPKIRSLISPSSPVLEEGALAGMSGVNKVTLKKYDGGDEQKVSDILSRLFTRPRIIREQGKCHYFCEQGRLSYGAFYLTHLGLIVIIIGVLIGTAGYQGYMQLAEGESSHIVTDRKSMRGRDVGFEVRCDRFEVTYYDKAQMPKDYKSTLTVLENGEAVLTKTIEVNDPLIYRGIYFYQSSYGSASGGKGEVTLKIAPAGTSQAQEYRVKAGRRFTIEGTGDEAVVESILPDFSLDEQQRAFSRSDEPRNPALQLAVFPRGKAPYRAWIFANYPDFHKKQSLLYDIAFVRFTPQFYTGLQVTRDPGVLIVWAGCILMIAGIYFAFFTSHRRLWLTIQSQGGQGKAVFAGRASKNRAGFDAVLRKLHEALKTMERP